jgi:hypothetical protein
MKDIENTIIRFVSHVFAELAPDAKADLKIKRFKEYIRMYSGIWYAEIKCHTSVDESHVPYATVIFYETHTGSIVPYTNVIVYKNTRVKELIEECGQKVVHAITQDKSGYLREHDVRTKYDCYTISVGEGTLWQSIGTLEKAIAIAVDFINHPITGDIQSFHAVLKNWAKHCTISCNDKIVVRMKLYNDFLNIHIIETDSIIQLSIRQSGHINLTGWFTSPIALAQRKTERDKLHKACDEAFYAWQSSWKPEEHRTYYQSGQEDDIIDSSWGDVDLYKEYRRTLDMYNNHNNTEE